MAVSLPFLTIGARLPEPQSRFNVVAGLVATTAAALSYLGFLALRPSPPPSLAIMLFASAPLCGALVLPTLVSRTRKQGDSALAWFTCGLGIAVLAMALQLMSLPAVVSDGGVFHTGNQGSAELYLLFHASLIAGAGAAALNLDARHLWVLACAGVVLAVLSAFDMLPAPTLLTADLDFTGVLTGLQFVVTAGLALSLVGWVGRTRSAPVSAIHGWIAVSLLLLAFEALFNALAAKRFDAVWWSSLSMRAAAFIVLLGGVSFAVASRLRRFERYSEGELSRRESELGQALAVSQFMLDLSSSLAKAITPPDVADVLSSALASTTGIGNVYVFDLTPDRNELRMLSGPPEATEMLKQRATALAKRTLLVDSGEPVPSVESVERLDELICRTPTGDGYVMQIPLGVAGLAIGAAVGWDVEVRPHNAELLWGIAAQSGPVLSRSRLYEREHQAADALQRALLPEQLPRFPTVSLAGRYVAGYSGVRVGGDWYDCIDVGGGMFSLVVGDVMGKGLLAATLMGRLRDAARVLVSVDSSPAAVLDGMNEVLLGADTHRVATVANVLVDSTKMQATVGLAGHPAPLLFDPDGKLVCQIGAETRSPLLGVAASARSQTVVDLELGCLLLLYTDGLTEARDGTDARLDQVVAHVRKVQADDCSVGDVADEVLACLPADATDDVALLVAKFDDGTSSVAT